MAGGRQQHVVQHRALLGKAQAALGEPANSQRIDDVLGCMHSIGQLVDAFVGFNRQAGLYGHRAAVELFGNEVHAATMFLVAGVECPAVGIQSLVFR